MRLSDTVRAFAHANKEVLQRRLKLGPKVPGWSVSFEVAVEVLRHALASLSKIPNAMEQREYLNRLPVPLVMPRSITIKTSHVGTLRCLEFTPKKPYPGTILHFHGGGYVHYPKAEHYLMATIAQVTNRRLVAPDYALAPERPYPAALDEALEVYQVLLEESSTKNPLYLGGDSAGGGLALSTLLRVQALGLSKPEKTYLISPWVDLGPLDSIAKSYEEFDTLTSNMAQQWSRWYLQGVSDQDPLVSPIRAELKGLPSLYIQSGELEVLHPQIQAFVAKATAAGVSVDWDKFPGMIHLFHSFGKLVPESREALRKIADYLHRPL